MPQDRENDAPYPAQARPGAIGFSRSMRQRPDGTFETRDRWIYGREPTAPEPVSRCSECDGTCAHGSDCHVPKSASGVKQPSMAELRDKTPIYGDVDHEPLTDTIEEKTLAAVNAIGVRLDGIAAKLDAQAARARQASVTIEDVTAEYDLLRNAMRTGTTDLSNDIRNLIGPHWVVRYEC